MKIKEILANSHSYGGTRQLSVVKAIVIHYTAGTKDTAENQGNYFKNGNTRSAGAHFFVDREGVVVLSVPMNRIAWSVGGTKYKNGGGKYYGTYNNQNTVSIELCAIADKDPSDKQVQSVKELITYIQKNCKNAKAVIRHYDVNGKPCPATMVSEDAWNKFLKRIAKAPQKPQTTTESGSYRVRVVTGSLNIRKGAGANYPVVGDIRNGEVYTVVKESNGWGKLKSGAGWIYLKYTERI